MEALRRDWRTGADDSAGSKNRYRAGTVSAAGTTVRTGSAGTIRSPDGAKTADTAEAVYRAGYTDKGGQRRTEFRGSAV